MFDHSEYINYHKSLAESHVDLRHSENQKSFVGTNFAEFSLMLKSSMCHKHVMHLLSLRGKLSEESGNVRDAVFGGFVLLVRNDHQADPLSEQMALAKAKEIGYDVILKIHYDSTDQCPGFLKRFSINQVDYRMTGVYENTYIGYAFGYPLMKQEITEFNPEKWQ